MYHIISWGVFVRAIASPRLRLVFLSQPFDRVTVYCHSLLQAQPCSANLLYDIVTYIMNSHTSHPTPCVPLSNKAEGRAEVTIKMCSSNSSTHDTHEPPSKPVPSSDKPITASDKHVRAPAYPVTVRSKPTDNGRSAFRNKWHQENLARSGGGGSGNANAGFTR